MNDYILYLKTEKKQLGILFFSLVLYCMGGLVLLPYTARRWTSDQKIGGLHVGTAVILGVLGILGIMYFMHCYVRKQEVLQGRKKILYLLLFYIVIQLLAGVLMGTTGELMKVWMGISYERTKILLYYITNIIQAMIQILLLFYVLCLLYWNPGSSSKILKIPLKKYRKELIIASIFFIVWSIGMIQMQGIKGGIAGMLVEAAIEGLVIVIVWIYLGTTLQRC